MSDYGVSTVDVGSFAVVVVVCRPWGIYGTTDNDTGHLAQMPGVI
jgi:hypothetical protein